MFTLLRKGKGSELQRFPGGTGLIPMRHHSNGAIGTLLGTQFCHGQSLTTEDLLLRLFLIAGTLHLVDQGGQKVDKSVG
jgi:hypothetical protein